MIKTLTIIIAILLLSCQSDKNTSNLLDIEKKEEFSPVQSTKSTFTSSRSTWQKPDLILNRLSPLEDKTVADIGAGTGYFTYRLAFKGAKVIPIDVDKDMISLMEGYIENLPSEIGNRITPRLVNPDNPSLSKGEVDIAIIINTIAYIQDRVNYLSLLKTGIKKRGKLMIVDYKTRDLNIPAPPLSERLAIGVLQKALRSAGYTDIIVDDSSLDYQYIIEARS